MKFLAPFLTAAILSLPHFVVNGQEKHMPEFEFIDTDNNFFSNKDIPGELAFMLVYFRTDCDECRHMVQALSEHAEEYPLTIWMVSPNDLETLRTFEYMTGLLQKENIHLLQDNQKMMHTWFNFNSLPYVVLFDKTGNQIASFASLPDAKTVTTKLNPQTNEGR